MPIDKRMLEDFIENVLKPLTDEETANKIAEDVKKSVEELEKKADKAVKEFSEEVINYIIQSVKSLYQYVLSTLPYVLPPFYELMKTADIVSQITAHEVLKKNLLANPNAEINIADVQTLIEVIYKYPERYTELRDYILQSGYSDKQLNIMLSNTIRPLTPEQALYLYKLGELDEEEFRTQLQQNLLDIGLTEKFKKLATNLLSDTDIRDSYLRGLMSSDELIEYLKKKGYTDEDIGRLISLFWIIPSPSDLITMAVREAFNEEAIQKFNLLEEFPQEFKEWAEKQGLSEYWAKKYWVAHWRLPSLTEGFEMFHRRVIDRDTLKALLKYADYPEFWRDKLIQISYNPLTRVDIRRAYDLSLLSTQEVYEAYLDLGYSPENAQKLTEIAINEVITEERNKLRTELIESYELGYITLEELREYLTQLKYPEPVVEILVSYAEYRKHNNYVKTLIRGIERQFVRGDISETEAENRLANLGIEPRDIVMYIDKWTAKKIDKEKTLTKEDIKQLYHKRVINREQAFEKLIRLGYSEENAELLLKLWE